MDSEPVRILTAPTTSVVVTGASSVVIAAAAIGDGAMIALVPSIADLENLGLTKRRDAEPADQLHLTLAYLGDAVDVDQPTRDAIVKHVTEAAHRLTPIETRAFGVAFWNPDGDDPAWVLNVGDVEPGQLEATRRALADDPLDGVFTPPAQHSPWVPHVCVAYSADRGWLAEAQQWLGPVTFDRVRIAFAGEYFDVPLG